MTVSVTAYDALALGNGITTVFPFSFSAENASDIKVAVILPNGVRVDEPPNNYTVSLGPGESGSVTMNVAPVSGAVVLVYRDSVSVQEVNITNQSSFNPNIVEQVWDRLTRLVQEVKGEGKKTLRSYADVAPFVPVPGGVLTFDPITGEPRADAVSAGNVADAGAYATDANLAKLAAEAARDKAQDWAEGSGEPGGPGTKSAKTHAQVAADYALASGPFANRTAAQAAIVPGDVDLIRVRAGDLLLEYLRDPGGTALQTADGANWSPAGRAWPEHWGAVGDGVSDETAAVQSAMDRVDMQVSRGTYLAETLSVPADAHIAAHPGAEIVHNVDSGVGVDGGFNSGIKISGLTVDMGYSRGLTKAGHGFRFRGNDITLSDVTVRDFAYDGANGGGTGALFFPDTGQKLSGIRLRDSTFIANTGGDEAFGWIFADTDLSFASNIFVSGAIGGAVGTGYAHELKNDARFNVMTGLIADNSSAALAYGNTTVGIDGADYNVAVGVVGKDTAVGWLVGEGSNNVLVGMVHFPDNPPALPAAKCGVRFSNDATANAAWAVLSAAPSGGAAVRHSSSGNFAQVAVMGSGYVARIDAGVERSVTEISHPGSRNSIFADVRDDSGVSTRGGTANVVCSPATGEQIGSLSGRFHQLLEHASPDWNASHHWRFEAKNYVIHSYGSDGTSGNIVGINHAVPGDANRAGFWNSLGNAPENDAWSLRGWGEGGLYSWTKGAFFPKDTTPKVSLGRSGNRFGIAYIEEADYGDGVRDLCGNGSPESVVTAAVGSTYRRRDGGAGTAFYVKESGSGNTGWVAK